jgi:hypothetical protein
MTEDELRVFSGDHLLYELEMAFWLVPLLEPYAARPLGFKENLVKNALLEAFVGHVRVLKFFLYDEPTGDDVSADHYVADVDSWHDARRPIPAELAEAARRVGKEIAHLTQRRLAPDAPGRDWNTVSVRTALALPLKSFLRLARPGVLDWRVQTLITEWK